MGFIRIAKIINDGEEIQHRIIDEDTLEMLDATAQQLVTANMEYVNFKITGNKKIIGKPCLSNPTIIRNNVVEEEHQTLLLVDIASDAVTLLDYNGLKETITIDEYIKLRKTILNNELCKLYKNELCLFLHRYGNNKGDRFVIPKECNEGTEGTEESIEGTEEGIEGTEEGTEEGIEETEEEVTTELSNLECSESTYNEQSKQTLTINENVGYSNETNTSELETGLLDDKQINKDSSIVETKPVEINECIDKLETEASEIKVDTEENISRVPIIKEIVFNMYSTDRITITLSEYNQFRSVILRILDSNMYNTLTISICKLYKSDNKSKFTLAFVKTDVENKTVNIQVIGHSDIADKPIEHSIEKICQTYVSWNKTNRFTSI